MVGLVHTLNTFSLKFEEFSAFFPISDACTFVRTHFFILGSVLAVRWKDFVCSGGCYVVGHVSKPIS